MTRRKLIKLAEKAYLDIVYKPHFIAIKKRSVIIIIREDGTIHRGDVDLTLARRMTPKEAAQALQLVDAATTTIAAALR